MSRPDPIEGALATIERSILPDLARLIDSLAESARAARPGMDAEARAEQLRARAAELAELTWLVASVTAQRVERISA
jgi:hypothetical protein